MSTERSTPTAPRANLARWAAALFGVSLAILFYSSSGHDDCHITFWSAYSLAEFGEIVNHSGQRVEQSSSLLHTLLLAGLYKTTGASMAWIAYLLGIAAALWSVLRLPALARALDWELGAGRLAVIATSPAFAYWQLGMLESSLFTLSCVEFLIQIARQLRPWNPGDGPRRASLFVLGGWTAALVTTRPEAGFLCVCVTLTLAALVLQRRNKGGHSPGKLRFAWLSVLISVLLFAAVIGWRQLYFGATFPHPVLSKMGGTSGPAQWATGMGYLLERFGNAAGGILVAGLLSGLVMGWVDFKAGRTHRLAPLVLLGAYMAFIVAAGGDWMKAWRFVGHVEIFFPFLLFQSLARTRLGPRVERALISLLLAVNVAGMLGLGAGYGTGRPLWSAWQVDPAVVAYSSEEATWPERANQVHARDVLMVDEFNQTLERILEVQDSVSILSKQGGLIPYYAAKAFYGRMEFLDILGIVSSHFDATRTKYDMRTGQKGLVWSMRDYFVLGRHDDDPIFHPDVIFDIQDGSAAFVAENGYVVIYEQVGEATGRYLTPAGALLKDRQAPEPEKLQRDLTFEQRYRKRLQQREVIEPIFWKSETDLYQYIAVKEELAEKAGFVEVKASRELLGRWPAASHHELVWSRARRQHLRFLFGERPAELPEPPAELPRVVTFTTQATIEEPGAQTFFLDASGQMPRTFRVDEALLDGRILTDADGGRLETPPGNPRLVLPARAGARAGQLLELRGLAVAEKRLRLTGRLDAR